VSDEPKVVTIDILQDYRNQNIVTLREKMFAELATFGNSKTKLNISDYVVRSKRTNKDFRLTVSQTIDLIQLALDLSESVLFEDNENTTELASQILEKIKDSQ
jgi:hypothetical protein